jgi:hypothetical protein
MERPWLIAGAFLFYTSFPGCRGGRRRYGSAKYWEQIGDSVELNILMT